MLCEVNVSLSLESGFTDLAKYINVCMEMTNFEATKCKYNIDWMLYAYKILFPICVYIKKMPDTKGKNLLKKKKHMRRRDETEYLGHCFLSHCQLESHRKYINLLFFCNLSLFFF